MSKELDVAVARAMGYRVVKDAQNVRGCQVGTAGRKGHDLPYYSEDYALIPVMLDWIDTHGLREHYMHVLDSLVLSRDPWEYIRATPEQHCHAFIACMQVP